MTKKRWLCYHVQEERNMILMFNRNKTMIRLAILFFATVVISSCNDASNKSTENKDMVKLITLDPGHFHAALVQKTMYKDVDSVVHVYAPAGNDLQLHMDRVNGYNGRKDDPTKWKEEVYSGNDYFEKMLA